jgi:Cu(I)/Ag(I) efflux system membrane fusion protein
LIQALRANDSENAAAVREKLRLWGLTQSQIDDIEKRKKPAEHMTIYSPISGIVIKKNVLEGEYVKTGAEIYTVADLSHLWVKLDAYESDLSFVKYGQDVELVTEAYPGEIFAGTVAFIDPILDEKTRTAKVRVNVENSEGKLKPGMFVHATVRPVIVEGGKTIGVNMAGKKVCPMHPEIVEDKDGSCRICGMDLVAAENTEYFDKEAGDLVPPLVIPISAPLLTGKRAIVYIQPAGKPGTYEGKQIVLGPRAGGYYIVREGLSEGDLVVTRGNFQLDSAQQIRGQISMMSPAADEGTAATTPQEEPTETRSQTHCPIMGGKINPELYVDHGGYRVFFCCGGCVEPFKKEADKHIKIMQDKGIVLTKSPSEQP